MTLYRKYRSQKLSELVGQPQVASILGQAIATQRIAHAYLFSGPRGTGKTSVARILAKAINCLHDASIELPCNECANCVAINQGSFLDVVEIDAASHRGIDDVRELVEQAQSVPSIGRYKVYILDEVHMFTREAFNALLKTLEEPPAHVVIILCTTESHKVPVTIASRCQRFVFSGASQEQLQQLLGRIAERENITMAPDAVSLLAYLADGGYRDGVMLLDQVITSVNQKDQAANEPITRNMIEEQLGLANQEVVQRIIELLISRQPAEMVEAIESFAATGGEVRYLTAGLIDMLRDLLYHSLKSSNLADKHNDQQQPWMSKMAVATTPAFLTKAIKTLATQPTNSSLHPALAVELSLLESLAEDGVRRTEPGKQVSEIKPLPVQQQPVGTASTSRAAEKQTSSAQLPTASGKQPEVANVLVQAPHPEQKEPEVMTSSANNLDPAVVTEPPADLATAWQQTLLGVLDQNKSVGSLLRHHCTPVSHDGTILLLQFWNGFHKKQVELDKNRLMVEEIASSVFGHPVKIRGELADKSLRPKRQPMTEEDIHNVAPVEPDSDLVDTALEMFGGELVDEQ